MRLELWTEQGEEEALYRNVKGVKLLIAQLIPCGLTDQFSASNIIFYLRSAEVTGNFLLKQVNLEATTQGMSLSSSCGLVGLIWKNKSRIFNLLLLKANATTAMDLLFPILNFKQDQLTFFLLVSAVSASQEPSPKSFT
ncbi:hypothetical protein Ancab_022586 [Ancistrocladus abbreviatus]